VLTVTFLALGILCALRSWSPWLVGLCLGAAVACRPNVIVLWPFCLAIMLQLKKDSGGRIQFWNVAGWAVASALPVVFSVGGLLYYNYLRFENFFDFGYTTIHGWDRLVQDAQTYGMFNLHFVGRNLNLMFLKAPTFMAEKPWIWIETEGLSMFLITPALFYIFRRYEKKIWVLGAWAGVLLSVGLLALYHNTGAYQFGYRYVLDFILPVVMLMAATLKKAPWPLIVLIILSILINLAGAWWFIGYNNF
jgi:hypothetical protein